MSTTLQVYRTANKLSSSQTLYVYEGKKQIGLLREKDFLTLKVERTATLRFAVGHSRSSTYFNVTQMFPSSADTPLLTRMPHVLFYIEVEENGTLKMLNPNREVVTRTRQECCLLL